MKTKQCFKCKLEKPLSKFYKHPQMPDGHVNKCVECNKNDVHLNRKDKENYYNEFDQNRYRKNILRMWKLKYSSMRRKTSGLGHFGTLKGKELLPKQEFISWCENTKIQFMEIYRVWVKSGYQRKLSPSIDRINNNLGYILGNMQWLTQRQNCKKHTNTKWFETCSIKGCKMIHRAKGLCNKHWQRESKNNKK